MDLTNVKKTFFWAWMLAGVCVSVIAAGPGLDAQSCTNHPYIVSPESVQYGSDVNLTCYILIEVKFITSISFTWKRNGERFTHGGNYEMSSGYGSFVNSIYKYYTNTLTVKDTSMTDEGNRYMCQVEVAVGSWSSSFNTEEYILGQEVPSTTTTTAHEGENVTIFLSWRVTDNVMWLWSPVGELIATIQSISVYIWPNSRSKVKVTRLMTSTYSKTVELVICNATKGDAGRYYLSDFKQRVFYSGHNLVVADRRSTTVTTNTVLSTVGQTTLQTTVPVSITSASTQDRRSTTVPSNVSQTRLQTTGPVSITSASTQDASLYTVTVSKYTDTSTTTGTPLSTAAKTDQNVTTVVLYIIVGCCVLLIALGVFIVAAIVLIRIKQQDSSFLRSRRSYITPIQNEPENIDSRGYAEIDNADIPELGEGNVVQPVINIKADEHVPPACGARNERDRRQLDHNCRKLDEDDEYEEMRPLDVISIEELAEEQEKEVQMQEHDQDIGKDTTDEMNVALPEASSHSHPMPSSDSSVHGRNSGNMALGIMNPFIQTSFMILDTDETWNAPVGTADIEDLSATIEIFPQAGRMTAHTTGAHQLSMEGSGDNAENEPYGAASNIYDSLMPHRPGDTYTALKNLGDTTDD